MRFSTQELRAVLADALRWPEVVAVAGPGETLGGRTAGEAESIVRFHKEGYEGVDYLIDWGATPDVDDGDEHRRGPGHFSQTVFCLTPGASTYHYSAWDYSRLLHETYQFEPLPDRSYICRGTVAFDSHNPSGLLWTLRRWHRVMVVQRGAIVEQRKGAPVKQ